MVLVVSLVTAVQPVIVEHCIHTGIIGIMACTYGVDIVLLHHDDIPEHTFNRYGTACRRVAVMAIGSLQHHTFAVDV